MLDLNDLSQGELLVLGRRALELCARRFDEIAEAADPADQPLQELLRKMAVEATKEAALAERQEKRLPDESRFPSRPEECLRWIRSHLTSLSKSFGEGPLRRDIALFLAESLEEEASRLYRALVGHARESRPRDLFSKLSERERDNLHYLREVVLQG